MLFKLHAALILILWLILPSAETESFETQNTFTINLSNDNLAFIYCDSTNAISFEEIKDIIKFSTPIKSHKKISLENNVTYWVYSSLKNENDYPIETNLNIGIIDSVDLFILKNEKLLKTEKLGRMLPSLDKGYQWGSWENVWAKIQIPSHSEVDIYLKGITASKMATSLEFEHLEAEDRILTVYKVNIAQGLFQGFMLMMLIQGLVFYIYTKRVGYLNFAIYSFLLALSYISVYGYTRYWSTTFINDYYLWAFLSQIGAAFYMQFIRTILEVKAVSKSLDKIVILLIICRVLGLIIISFNIVLYQNLFIIQNTILIVDALAAIIGLAAIIYLISKGNPFAQYALIGTLLLILGVILAIFATIEFIPFRSEFYSQAGITLQCIVLSIGLANELKDRAQGEIQAKQEVIAIKDAANKELEQKVAERTYELMSANNAISEQNEELIHKQEEIQTQRDAIELKNKELNSKNNRIESSLQVAQTIQKAILPKSELLNKLFKDYFILNKPKDVVSGDFFWLTQMPEGNIILVVADCTGHGVPGALMTMISHILLDKIVKLWEITSPQKIFETLHNEISHVLRQDETGDQNGMDAAIVHIEKRNGASSLLTFCGARNHLYYSVPSQNKIESIMGSRKGVGGRQDPKKTFENHVIEIEENTCIYLGSDGLIDQANTDKRRFGKIRLERILNEIKGLSMSEQKEKIEISLIEYMKNTEQRDDILWMGLQV